jgi:hypothetical protein
MRARVFLAAIVLGAPSAVAQDPPSWWPYPVQPTPQAAAVAQAQVQAIALPALPAYGQSAPAVRMRYVGPGPIRRALGDVGERLAGLKRGHYVAEPAPAAATVPPQGPIVLLVTMPAQPVQPSVAQPSAQAIRGDAAPPPPQAPLK